MTETEIKKKDKLLHKLNDNINAISEMSGKEFLKKEVFQHIEEFPDNFDYGINEERTAKWFHQYFNEFQSRDFISEKDVSICFDKNIPYDIINGMLNDVLYVSNTKKLKNDKLTINFLSAILQTIPVSLTKIYDLHKKLNIKAFDAVISDLEKAQIESGFSKHILSANLKYMYLERLENAKNPKTVIKNNSRIWCILDKDFIKDLIEKEYIEEKMVSLIINNTPDYDFKDFLFSNYDCDYGLLCPPLTNKIEEALYESAVSVFDVENATPFQRGRASNVIKSILSDDKKTHKAIIIDLYNRCDDIVRKSVHNKDNLFEAYEKILLNIAETTKNPETARVLINTCQSYFLYKIIETVNPEPDDKQISMATTVYKKDCSNTISDTWKKFVAKTVLKAKCEDKLYDYVFKHIDSCESCIYDANDIVVEAIACSVYTPEKYNKIYAKENTKLKFAIKFKEMFLKNNFGSVETLQNILFEYLKRNEYERPQQFYCEIRDYQLFSSELSKLCNKLKGTKAYSYAEFLKSQFDEFMFGKGFDFEKRLNATSSVITSEFRKLHEKFVINNFNFSANESGFKEQILDTLNKTKENLTMCEKICYTKVLQDVLYETRHILTSVVLNECSTYQRNYILRNIVDCAEDVKDFYLYIKKELRDSLMDDIKLTYPEMEKMEMEIDL